MLLTRSPLSPRMQAPLDPVRLACVKHAASVHPEPGSNSPTKTKNKPTKNSRQKTIQPKKPDQNGSSQKTIQQKQTPTIKKQNVPKSSASKKQKQKKPNPPQKTRASPAQSHTNKTKKHTIENTNNQTTNQPNWPVRIRHEQKIIGGKLASRRLRRSATNTKLPPLRPRVKPD